MLMCFINLMVHHYNLIIVQLMFQHHIQEALAHSVKLIIYLDILTIQI